MYSNVFFTDATHRYFDDSDNSYQSVSAMIGGKHEPFDESMNIYCAIKELFPNKLTNAKKKYEWNDPKLVPYIMDELTVDEVNKVIKKSSEFTNQWDEMANFGTSIHDNFEQKDISRRYKISPFDGEKYKVIARPFKEGKYDNKLVLPFALDDHHCNIYIPESVVAYHPSKKAGQIDKLWLYWTGSRHIAIVGDYKTDNKISKYPMWKKEDGKGRKKPMMFYKPLDYFPDSKYWYYTLKMSCYAYMLEYLGIPVHSMYLWHFYDKDNMSQYNHIPITYYRNHIKNLF
jgi:hypothetical protein